MLSKNISLQLTALCKSKPCSDSEGAFLHPTPTPLSQCKSARSRLAKPAGKSVQLNLGIKEKRSGAEVFQIGVSAFRLHWNMARPSSELQSMTSCLLPSSPKGNMARK